MIFDHALVCYAARPVMLGRARVCAAEAAGRFYRRAPLRPASGDERQRYGRWDQRRCWTQRQVRCPQSKQFCRHAHFGRTSRLRPFRMQSMSITCSVAHSISTLSASRALTQRMSVPRSRRPVRLRVLFARHRMGRTGCGVPHVALHATLGRLRKPALRHYERTRGARRR